MSATRDGGSLRRRLLGWLLVATALLGVLALLDTWREALRTAAAVSDRVLAGSALAIAERVFVDLDGALVAEVPYSALEMLASTAQDRVFYRVDGPGGASITGYSDLPVVPGPAEGAAFADATYAGEPVRLATLRREALTGVDAIPFAVTVAETTRARRELARAILWRSALRLGGMIAGAALVVWLAVTRALRPLDGLSRALAARAPGDLSPLRDEAPQEVRGLVEAVNGVMARLGTTIEALRNFTGNAGHQIRTPLAVVRAQVALAARAGRPDEAAHALTRADAALAEAERVLAQLLLLARVDAAGAGPPPEAVDLGALARDLTAELVPRAARAGIDLGFEAGAAPLRVRAEPTLLREMLRNLVENAIAYAGRGAVVTVRVARAGAQARVEVEDDGPGLPPGLAQTALRRFARGREEGPPGLGLGLPIVDEIARRFGGHLDLGPGRGGRGLRAVVTLAEAA
ncbi:sensor histidine kinase [Rubellimicrobium roseum]|uniref:histidine kinase n=1 Tax=Rubellimicrobium roseum TaxID=687525 RepID=A0A5C4NE40_9RHOB|nr:sensor histidine kinase [Rubellimicrobium roseum]TNC72170.1 HAMP domain-containing protein [Rubellimicrobium roseum]